MHQGDIIEGARQLETASLQLNVWRRAEDPGKLTHELQGGGNNSNGFTALEKQALLHQHVGNDLALQPPPAEGGSILVEL
jgi:hypothetical protein